jgi:hypothetical protein
MLLAAACTSTAVAKATNPQPSINCYWSQLHALEIFPSQWAARPWARRMDSSRGSRPCLPKWPMQPVHLSSAWEPGEHPIRGVCGQHILVQAPYHHGGCHRVKTMTSMLFELVSMYGSLVAQVNLGTQESRRGDVTFYPGSGQFGPYVQQLMILILKSTQIWGVTIKCKWRRFGRGLARY